MTHLQKILYKYRDFYSSLENDSPIFLQLKGKWFENICRYFLKYEPLYQQRFEEVWLWADWPDRNNRPDTGIDIVAKRREDGKLCAVQCKFYEPEYSIGKADIDSFLAASGKKDFVERIIISTAGNWNKNAQDTIQKQQIPCSCLTLQNLEQSVIDWSLFDINALDKVTYLSPKKLREDQIEAVNAVINGFKEHERGKLIMACGTGKTFTSLKIAEKIAGIGKKTLFLVPSIALLNQTLIAWSADHDRDIKALFFAVCSDRTVGKDEEDLKVTDLALPATTNVDELVQSWNNLSNDIKENSMTVIFSTYQSLQVISQAQDKGFPVFDLIICDEAHRTTGVTLAGDDDSNFTKVHDNNYIRASKRLYMTATPKIFSASHFRKAKENNAILWSMDDEAVYGSEFYRLSFSQAVKLGLLSDYKVMILAIYDNYVSNTVSALQEGEIKLDDAAKIIGCWKGLSKHLTSIDADTLSTDPAPMRSAVAFSSTIKNSERFRDNFASIINSFNDNNQLDEPDKKLLSCEVHHVDGKQPMSKRITEISWLKEITDNRDKFDNSCRILSNAKCLSEGVDIPALDAILFLNPRKSEIDIIQSVGRVMRRSEGKKFGYVILPVVIPGNIPPDEALDNNDNYKVVWQVLQALRAHDDNFNIIVNSLDLNKHSDKIITNVIGVPDNDDDINKNEIIIPFPPEEWKNAIYVRIVQKCGDREYWDKWARDMARIAQNHTTRIKSLIKTKNDAVSEIFKRYINGLRKNINNSLTEDDAIDMLSQHMILKPIFDAIFNDFSAQNPISKTMEDVLNLLKTCGLESETEILKSFYESNKEKAEAIKSDNGRQKIIKDLYERFFQTAFKKTSDRLGIVYTPNEVVDFILRSADWALKNEFNISEGLSSINVHILDPFTGTGTFIARLLQLGLISPDVLKFKYQHELHANEILLLAYYIAAVNIESTYHSISNENSFTPFPGIVLTDTFNMYDSPNQQFEFVAFQENNERVENQRKTPITVIVGNPPYSVGQTSANDNNQNLKYNSLDDMIANSYAARSTATNKNSLYDSYIRAIRWASDRIKDQGIICYVTNGSFIDSNSADGLRKCLYEEFQSIYIFNLRGNQYTSGELSRKEGGKIFGSGSRLPVAVTLLVKNPNKTRQNCKLFYYDIGDYLKREEKLRRIEFFGSFGNMLDKLSEITPNENGDWINQRSKIFEGFIRLGNKKEEGLAIFEQRYSQGVKTNRDAWCYKFSRDALKKNMISMIDVYNQERERYHSNNNQNIEIEDFVTLDNHKISWDGDLYKSAEKNKKFTFKNNSMRISLYRPYVKENIYFNHDFNNRVYLMPSIFPTASSENKVICISGIGTKTNFSTLITDCIPDLSIVATSQCFPLYWYEENQNPEDLQGKLFDNEGEINNNQNSQKYIKRDAISDDALSLFQINYNDRNITKEDIFYYIYGILNSPEYVERFADDVKKILARVPLTKGFWNFSQAGRKLADLHINYENVRAWPIKLIATPLSPGTPLNEPMHRIDKIKIVTINGQKSIRYNENLTITDIPEKAWKYIVNGKSALDWIIERYQDSTDKDSGLRNDCNAWGIEHNNPRYILDLIERVFSTGSKT